MKVLFRIILLCPFISFGALFSQEEWDFDKKNQNKPLFLDTRAINGHTVKLLEKEVIFKEDLEAIFGKREWDAEELVGEVKDLDEATSADLPIEEVEEA